MVAQTATYLSTLALMDSSCVLKTGRPCARRDSAGPVVISHFPLVGERTFAPPPVAEGQGPLSDTDPAHCATKASSAQNGQSRKKCVSTSRVGPPWSFTMSARLVFSSSPMSSTLECPLRSAQTTALSHSMITVRFTLFVLSPTYLTHPSIAQATPKSIQAPLSAPAALTAATGAFHLLDYLARLLTGCPGSQRCARLC